MCEKMAYSDMFLAQTTVQTTLPTIQTNISARQQFLTICQPATLASKWDFASYPKPYHLLASLIISVNTKCMSFGKGIT